MNLMTCKGQICLRSYNTDRYSSLKHQSRKYLSTNNLISTLYISFEIEEVRKLLETASNFNFHPSSDLDPDNAEESS